VGGEEPSGARTSSEVSESYLDHLKCINATFYDQLKVVDQKAAYVFTFLIAMMIWSAEVRGHFARVLEPVARPEWLLSVVLASSLTVAAVSAILLWCRATAAAGHRFIGELGHRRGT
jgi:hypothetical protein